MIASVNPATGEMVAEFGEHSPEEVERRLELARAASAGWRATPVEQRAAIVAAAGELLEAEQERFGRLMTLEMGKTLTSAIAESQKCASGCRYYAEHGPSFIAPEVIAQSGERGEARFEPLGAVLAVMPWNFPFWQVVRFAAPALVGGNVGLLKHASNVPQCALALEDLFRRAGAPEGVFQTLLIGSGRVDAVICLGSVIRGETTHYELVAGEAAAGIQQVQLTTGVPVAFGVLTTDTIEQAVERAGTKAGNKGADAALTAIETVNVFREMGN